MHDAVSSEELAKWTRWFAIEGNNRPGSSRSNRIERRPRPGRCSTALNSVVSRL